MNPMRLPKAVISLVVVLIAAGGGYFWWKDATTPGKYDGFTTCLKDKGLTFYGAYWCPHCTAQKKRFGKSARLLPYVECAVPGSNDLVPVCKDAGVKSFPTWTGPGDWRAEGEIELDTLAERSGCQLPD